MHLSHFLGYTKLAVLLTKTLIFNKVKRNSHDQVLNIINIGYVLLMILRNYILPFWHGAYYIATGLHVSLESTKVSVLYLHSLWNYTCRWTWLSYTYQSHCHVSSVLLVNFGGGFRFIIYSSGFIFLFWDTLSHWSPCNFTMWPASFSLPMAGTVGMRHCAMFRSCSSLQIHYFINLYLQLRNLNTKLIRMWNSVRSESAHS